MTRVTGHFDTDNMCRFVLRNLVFTTKAFIYHNAETCSYKLCCPKIRKNYFLKFSLVYTTLSSHILLLKIFIDKN